MRARTGDVFQTRAGTYCVRMRLPNGTRKSLGTFATWEEAEAMRIAALEHLKDELGENGIRLVDFGAKVLDAREERKLVRDTGSDRSRWSVHIEPAPIARMLLRNVRLVDVQEWFDVVLSKVSRQTALNALNVLRVIFKAALKGGLVTVNPTVGVDIPRETKTEEPWTYLTPDEQARLVAAMDAPMRHLVAFSIWTGVRAGELAALRSADVHLDDAIPRMVIRYGRPPTLPTKGGKPREVPLLPGAVAAVKAWRASLPRYCKANPLGLEFPARRGGYRDRLHLVRWDVWQKAIEDAKLGRDLRWHDLRHTCASSLVSGWWGRSWSLEEVKAMLGHADITTTQRYAHLAGTALLRAAHETTQWANNGQRELARKRERPEKQAPPRRIERPTNGLGKPCTSQEDQRVSFSFAHSLPEAFLRAVAEGDEVLVGELLEPLARLVLDDPRVALAEKVLGGGLFAVSAGVELAGMLAATPQDVAVVG